MPADDPIGDPPRGSMGPETATSSSYRSADSANKNGQHPECDHTGDKVPQGHTRSPETTGQHRSTRPQPSPPVPHRGVGNPGHNSSTPRSTAVSHHLDPRPDHLDPIQAAMSDEVRQHRMRSATIPATSPADQQFDHRTHPHIAHIQTPKNHRTRTSRTARTRNLHITPSLDISIDRQPTGKYDRHRWKHLLGPLPSRASETHGEGVPRVQGPHILRGPHHAIKSPAELKPSPTSTAENPTNVITKSRR